MPWPSGRNGRDLTRRFTELAAWAQVLECGDEGLVGKDEASAYRESRTLSWLKMKVPHYRDGERVSEPQKA